KLFVSHPSYQRKTETIAAAQAQVTVTLGAGLELTGAVITHDGREPLGFEVEARGPDGSTQKATVTAGRYALGPLAPGDGKRPLASSSGLGSEGDPSGAQTFNAVTPGVYTAVIRVKDFPGMVWTESFEVSSSMPSTLRMSMPRGLTPLP